MKVFLVYSFTADGIEVIDSVHKTYAGALESFHELRNDLIEECQQLKKTEIDKRWIERWDQHIEKLQEQDPEEIDNFPQETPHIMEMELK